MLTKTFSSSNSASRALRPGSNSHSTGKSRRVLASAILVTTSLFASTNWAGGLPDFASLVQEQGETVVSIGVVRDSFQPTAGNDPSLQQLPEQLRRYFEQVPRGESPRMQPGRGVGSGFIISEDGYVVTNAHVVNGASEIVVNLDDRRQMPAELIGLDEATDIALLKVDASKLPVAELGDSDSVHVGEWVLAIGSPFGLDHTATQGIVSAVARNLPSGGYAPFIQTDVAVNPGNSGGPLFNTEGEVIGVNSQIYSNSGGYQGLSFAIPINVAKHVVEQLKETGHASRGWLGVAIQDVDQGLADAFGLDSPRGALVSNVVSGAPAEAAGLESGDIIIGFNGAPVDRSGDLPALVAVVPAGDKATVTLLRDGREKTLDVTIGEFDTGRLASADSSMGTSGRLGLVVGNIDDDQLREMGIDHGVRIVDVKTDGPAASAALAANDVILSIDGMEIGSVKDFRTTESELEPGKRVAVLVMRGDRTQYVALEVPQSHE